MIPLPLIAVGGFIRRNWEVILLIAIVATVLLTTYAMGRNHERKYWKPKLEAMKSAHAAASTLAAQERAADEQTYKTNFEKVRLHYEDRVHAGNAALDAALARVRDNSRLRPLAKAEAAPTACRDYEADPTRLSEQDAGFLVREAARADGVVIQLQACQSYAVDLHKLCSAP